MYEYLFEIKYCRVVHRIAMHNPAKEFIAVCCYDWS